MSKKKKVKKSKRVNSDTRMDGGLFSELYFILGATPKDIMFIAARDQMPCFCYLESTPIHSPIFFHSNTKYYA